MKPVFRSKSANVVDFKKVDVQFIESLIQYVVTIGEAPLRSISDVKFIELEDSDFSILCKTMALVVCSSYYDGKINGAICFAVEYGIPVIWLSTLRPPIDKMFMFDLITDNRNIVWRYLCQIK